MNKKESVLSRVFENQRHFRFFFTLLTLVLYPTIYFFVYLTGGTQFSFLHVMYVPVVLTGFLYGVKGGLLGGIFGGLILGPIMPFDSTTGEMQHWFNWTYRLFSFSLIGMTVGGLISYLLAQLNKMFFQTTHNVESSLPNFNYYLQTHSEHSEKRHMMAITLQINNYESLVILLGRKAYNTVLGNLYTMVKKILPDSAIIIQADARRLWIEMPKSDYDDLEHDFTVQLEDKTFYGENVPLYLDFSLGFSMGDEAKTAPERFNESDIAALHAKNNALKYVVFHDAHKEDQLLLQRLGELPLAIKNDELFVVYQPVLDMAGNVIQLEALIRWRNKGEVLSPAEFIPLAEETRLIDQITSWLLDVVIRDYQTFFKIDRNIKMAINISQRNLYDPSLIESMIERIKKSNIQQFLEIEMTESTLMLNRSLTQSFLEAFKHIGVESILDDFGTGYSSLSCLRDLPVKKVKIDQDFTLNITESNETKQLVKTIVELAHHMDLDVIAEGVEDKEILEILKELEVDYIQGFLFSRPLSFEDTTLYLKKT